MPKNLIVQNIKPKLKVPEGETIVYTENKTINVGQSMGLLLSITYPTTLTFSAPRV